MFLPKVIFFCSSFQWKKNPPESEIGLLDRRLTDSFAYFMDMLHQAKPLPSALPPIVNGKKTSNQTKRTNYKSIKEIKVI